MSGLCLFGYIVGEMRADFVSDGAIKLSPEFLLDATTNQKPSLDAILGEGWGVVVRRACGRSCGNLWGWKYENRVELEEGCNDHPKSIARRLFG